MSRQEVALPVGASISRKARLAAEFRRYRRSPSGVVGAVMIILVISAAIFVSFLAPFSPRDTNLRNILDAPSRAHLLGTDELGRDILSRVLYGTQPALMVGLISVGLAILIGVPLGMVAGYFRGAVDVILCRIFDTFLAFPTLVLALAIAAMFGAGLRTTIVAISFVYWPQMARLVRGQTLSLRERDYVMASESIGATKPRILFRHIAPNLAALVIVASSINLAGAILIEAALSFLGLGIPPPSPSWGLMLRTGYAYLDTSFWPSVVPGIAIFITVLGFNLLGDGLRDFLDPRLRHI